MAQIYANAAAGTITDNPLSTVATAINSAAFTNLPAVAAPDFMYLTIDPTGIGGLPEIVKVTAHTAAATVCTVVRYSQVQAGLTAASGRTHALNTIWRHLSTKASFDDLAALVPAGTVRQTVATSADPGWLLFNQTAVGAQTLYPALWAVAPAAWKSGADLVLPNLADTVIAGAGATAIGATGGANTKTIASGNLPPHTHTGGAHTHAIDHNHANATSTANSVDHVHSVDPPSTNLSSHSQGGANTTVGASAYVALLQGTGGTAISVDISAFNSLGASATHTHDVDLPNFTGSSGSAGTVATDNGGFANTALDVRSTHLALTYQIKAH